MLPYELKQGLMIPSRQTFSFEIGVSLFGPLNYAWKLMPTLTGTLCTEGASY